MIDINNDIQKTYYNFYRKHKLKKISILNKKVFLPFNEEGIVVDYKGYTFDPFPYKVKITKADIFNKIGDIVDFKEKDLRYERN